MKIYDYLLGLSFGLMAFLPFSIVAQTMSVDEAIREKDSAPADNGPLKLSNAYVRLSSHSIDSAFTKVGFDFLNSRMLNDVASQKNSYHLPPKNGIIRAFGGELGMTGVADDETNAAHFHISYFRGRNGHVYANSVASNNKIYTNPVTIAVQSSELSASSFDDLSAEGWNAEYWKEFYFFHVTKNPYFKYIGFRFGLGLMTEKTRMRGLKMSEVATTVNGTPTTANYYPGIMPSGLALRSQAMDYRQTDGYLLAGISYRAPIGRHHEIDASAESLLIGVGGGYYEYTERMIMAGDGPGNDTATQLMYMANVMATTSLEGPVASYMQGLRYRLGYTFKPDEQYGIRIMYGQTTRRYKMYTPKLKSKDQDSVTPAVMGDIQSVIAKSIDSIGVSRVAVTDLRHELSVELQTRF